MDGELVTENGSRFLLPGLRCVGDESRLCCNVDLKTRGQPVVATGAMKIFKRVSTSGTTWQWVFSDQIELCRLKAE
jgi:hypothetical protein